MRSASVSWAWNISVRRQSNARVATERITSFLPRLTPKLVSRPQIATRTAPGTPDYFDLLEHRRQRLHVTHALGHAVARDHAAGKFLEGLLEHALALVGEYRWVERQAVERAGTLLRDALRGGVPLKFRDEGVEPARRTACGGECRRAENRSKGGRGECFNESDRCLAS
jgi:hypothetical protein